MKRKKTPCFT